MNNPTPDLLITADMREQRSKVCGYLEKSQKVIIEEIMGSDPR